MKESRIEALLRERLKLAEELAAALETRRRLGTVGGEELWGQMVALWKDEASQPHPKAAQRMIRQRWLAAARTAEMEADQRVKMGVAGVDAQLKARRARLEAEVAVEQTR